MARRLAGAAAAGMFGLALMAFQLPVPVPSVSPTVPAPLPSLVPLLGGSGSGAGQQQNAQQPAAQAPASNRGTLSAPPAAQTGTSSAPAASSAADGPIQTHVQAAATAQAARLPGAAARAGGSGPRGGAGAPAAPQPWLLAALGVALALLVRRLAPLPRRAGGKVSVSVRPLAGDAPLEAAVDAAVTLCESMLPDGAEVRRLGGGAIAVVLGDSDSAKLEASLGRISQRARRVGLDLEWASSGRPQFAERLVPA